MTSLAENKTAVFAGLGTIFLLSVVIAVFTGYYYLAGIPFAILCFLYGWQSLAVPFFLLMICIPFSMEYQLTPALGTDFPDELMMLLVGILFCCYWAFKPLLIPANVLKHPLIVLTGLGLLWAIISSVASTQPLLSIKFLLAKAWYIAAFMGAALILFQEKRHIKLAAMWLCSSMVAVMLIILLRHAPYQFSFADINKALQPFFRNHVNYSALLVCITPLLYAFYRFSNSRMLKVILIFISLVVLVALFLSYSRGAWLALLTGFGAWWMIRKRVLMKVFVIALGLCFGILTWLISDDRYLKYAHDYKTTIFHEDFQEHLVATYHGKDVSTAERFYRWIAGVRMIKEHPVAGFGPNSFYYNYRPYAVPAFKTWVSNNPEHSTVHNYFLLLAIEQGIPGLVIFLSITLLLISYSQRVYHRSEVIFYKRTALVAGSVVMMVVTVNFLSDLIETDKIGSVFFLCLSALVIADTKSRTIKVAP